MNPLNIDVYEIISSEKRLGNIMANLFNASFQSRIGIVHFLARPCIARYKTFINEFSVRE